MIDRANPEPVPPAIHAAYSPTLNLHPADAITFKARTFCTTDGQETWDFGDGTPAGDDAIRMVTSEARPKRLRVDCPPL